MIYLPKKDGRTIHLFYIQHTNKLYKNRPINRQKTGLHITEKTIYPIEESATTPKFVETIKLSTTIEKMLVDTSQERRPPASYVKIVIGLKIR